MIVAAIILIALGLVVALLGFKLFRVLLPLVGFVSGLAVGFIGFQAVFGKGAVSTSVAIMVAVIVGVVLAILSYAFFEIAMIVIAAIIGASALSFLGIALGLDQNGFVVFLLGLAGVILGIYLASMYPVSATFVLVLTSAIGVAVLMAGIMLVVGDVSVDELNNNGIIPTVLSVVDQSFLWFIVWVGGTLASFQFQNKLMLEEFVTDTYQWQPRARSRS